jgi:SAM-dependent methyltransferase
MTPIIDLSGDGPVPRLAGVTDDDRDRWDRRYTDRPAPTVDDVALPAVFAPFADIFPTAGRALDLACGPGAAAVWLAGRGMAVHGYDVSRVAIARARDLARHSGCAERCRFEVADLDEGLPAGEPVDVVVCLRFRDPRLDRDIIERLCPGGLLAISALSEVGGRPGPFAVRRGALTRAFPTLDVVAAGEGHGEAWLLARRSPAGAAPDARRGR